MKKYIVNKNREELSSEFIAKGRDFRAVQNGARVQKNNWYKSPSLFISIVLALSLCGVYVLYNTSEQAQTITEEAFIAPPIGNVDIPFKAYTVTNSESSQIKSPSGAVFSIPKNAFINANGKQLAGEVEIKMREFYTQSDIFLAGIPMQYDSLGVANYLESAGMIEIRAFQNGQEVFLALNKQIKLSIPSKYEGADYNLYYLNEEQKNWVYKGKDSIYNSKAKEPAVHAPKIKDAVALASLENALVQIRNEIKVLKLQEPSLPSQLNKDKWNIKLNVLKDEFPELLAYDDVLWEIMDTEVNVAHENIIWNDILISRSADSLSYILKFKNANKHISYKAKPVYTGDTSIKLMDDYNLKYANYQKQLNNRLAQEQKQLREIEAARQLRKAQQEAKRANQILYNNSLVTENAIMRSFAINKLGVWNCDRIPKLPKRQNYKVLFTDERGEPILLNSLFIINKSINSVFPQVARVRVNDIMYYKMNMSPRADYLIIGVTSNNKLATLASSAFKSKLSDYKSELVLSLNIKDEEIKSYKEFSKLFKEL